MDDREASKLPWRRQVNRFGDIKILDHLMAVIVMCHFNALSGNSYQQLMSCIGRSSSLRISSFKYLYGMTWMFSRQANIFVCALWSRPGLFVPTLFVMHDVSLTPTKKVA
ncbi:hypothetical protein K492DRAFT_173185 [Lichtheimia hyalospora FSU 10163]|nr:hypothetical protein K492DRAFT_173185 [Lichtheimia hyalospora FSU 10163]